MNKFWLPYYYSINNYIGFAKDMQKTREIFKDEIISINPYHFSQICLYLNHKCLNQTTSYESKKNKLFENHRCFIFDTLIHIGLQFKLQDRTVFLAFDYFDIYFKSKLQNFSIYHLFFYGLVCLIIASKFEETYPPSINVKYMITLTKGISCDVHPHFAKRPAEPPDFQIIDSGEK